MSETIPPPGAETLNGWKEIGAFLGKSVRAVQRWEHDFGLPVHRIKTPNGQVVYAFASEIEAWRVAMRQRPADSQPELASEGETEPAAEAERPDPPPARAQRHFDVPRSAWIVLLGAVAVIAVIAGSFLRTKAAASALKVTAYQIVGTSLVALSAEGHTVWSHDFGWLPEPLKYSSPERVRTAEADLDGDGTPEVLAVIHSPVQGGEAWRETIYCFAGGRLRWTYTPASTLTYEGRKFEAPWREYAMTTSPGPGRQRVWVSFGHHTWWPSFVVELDASGKATPRYFQSGAIYNLSVWSASSGEYLVATGVDNEYARASVAIMNIDSPVASSPQHAGTGFHCDSCPQAGPDFFAALPRSELNRVSGAPYNRADGGTPNGSELKIYTEEVVRKVPAGAIYSLRDGFIFHDVAFNDAYWDTHRAMELEGELTHSAHDCPDQRHPARIATWSQAHGWSEAAAPVAPAPTVSR